MWKAHSHLSQTLNCSCSCWERHNQFVGLGGNYVRQICNQISRTGYCRVLHHSKFARMLPSCLTNNVRMTDPLQELRLLIQTLLVNLQLFDCTFTVDLLDSPRRRVQLSLSRIHLIKQSLCYTYIYIYIFYISYTRISGISTENITRKQKRQSVRWFYFVNYCFNKLHTKKQILFDL